MSREMRRNQVRSLLVRLLKPENVPAMVEVLAEDPERREFLARFLVAYAERHGEEATDQVLEELEARFVAPILEKYPLGPVRGWISGKIMAPLDEMLPRAVIQPILSLLLPGLAKQLGSDVLYETLMP